MKTETEIGRYELKYLVPAARRDEIAALVSRDAVCDPHARPLPDGSLGYRVHSIYFDTPQLTDYFERLERRRIRNRLRIRTYGEAHENQPVFLENKRKSGRWVVKHRALAATSGQRLRTADSRPWRSLCRHPACNRFAAHSFRQLVDGGGRVPVTVVHYEREVFVPRHARDCHRRVRLTLDHNVRAVATNALDPYDDGNPVALLPPEWMVLEMKFEAWPPRWMTALHRLLEISSVPVSKFGLSIARIIRANQPWELLSLLPPLPATTQHTAPDTRPRAAAITRSGRMPTFDLPPSAHLRPSHRGEIGERSPASRLGRARLGEEVLP